MHVLCVIGIHDKQIKSKKEYRELLETQTPDTTQVCEGLVPTLEHMQVPKWDRTSVRRRNRPLFGGVNR